MIKGGTLRIRIESKPSFKARYGKSPDLADAAFLCLDLARQRHGLTAVSPPEGVEGGSPPRRRSIKQLMGALTSGAAPLE